MKKLDKNPKNPQSFPRRKFLQLTSGSVLGAMAMPSEAFSFDQGQVELTFGHGPDDSGVIRQVIDRFNQQHRGRIRVNWRVMARESNEYHRQLTSDFNVESGEIDVFSADVPWTAEFARKKWIAELSKRFYNDYRPEDFLVNTLKSTYYNYRMWGVPWYSDAGLLYYRKDLLQASGFSTPPKTWRELQTMAAKVMQDSRTAQGFVFQGADYEGAVTNALEYIWNAGGRVLTGNISVSASFGQSVIDPNVITVNSQDAARGLDAVVAMIDAGVVSRETADYAELESYGTFLRGDAVFLRGWPAVFGIMKDVDRSTLVEKQVGIAPLPTISPDHTSYSCQGGWNLMINAFSDDDKRDAAWTFIRFMTAPDQQKFMAMNGGFFPVNKALYDDAEVLNAVPVIEAAKDIMTSARVRPVTPFYHQIAPRISRMFNRVVLGEYSGTEAVAILEQELRTVLRKNR